MALIMYNLWMWERKRAVSDNKEITLDRMLALVMHLIWMLGGLRWVYDSGGG